MIEPWWAFPLIIGLPMIGLGVVMWYAGYNHGIRDGYEMGRILADPEAHIAQMERDYQTVIGISDVNSNPESD